MKANMGPSDRVVRVLIGFVIIAIGVTKGSWWGVIGLVPLLTGLVSRCPAYIPFGISTRRKA